MNKEEFIARYCYGDEEIYEALLIMFSRNVTPEAYKIMCTHVTSVKD